MHDSAPINNNHREVTALTDSARSLSVQVKRVMAGSPHPPDLYTINLTYILNEGSDYSLFVHHVHQWYRRLEGILRPGRLVPRGADPEYAYADGEIFNGRGGARSHREFL